MDRLKDQVLIVTGGAHISSLTLSSMENQSDWINDENLLTAASVSVFLNHSPASSSAVGGVPPVSPPRLFHLIVPEKAIAPVDLHP